MLQNPYQAVRIEPEEFEAWRIDPVTKALMKKLYKEREMMKENLLDNVYEDESKVKGICFALGNLLNLDYEAFIDE